MTPTPTIDKSQIPHYPKLSETAARVPPMPMASRPIDEQNMLRNLAGAAGMDVETLVKSFSVACMRAATTVITDREMKSKIRVMETDHIPAPKLGNTAMLTRQHEDYIKARFGKIYFENLNKQSHPLKYILELHSKVSETWQLDNDCSIDLLTRCLRGDAFKRIHHYLKLERSITRCYQVLQSIYSDELTPAQAQTQLDRYIKNPSLHEPPHNTLEEVFLHIHLLCSRIHSLELEPSKTQNTLSSVFSSVRWYLTANFVEREVKQLYQDFDTYMNDYPEEAVTSEAFFILKYMAKNKFLATPPRHMVMKMNPVPPMGGFRNKKISQSLRPMGRLEEIAKNYVTKHASKSVSNLGKLEEIHKHAEKPDEIPETKNPYEDSEEEEDPEKLGLDYAEANPDECMFMGDEEEASESESANTEIPKDEVLEMTPDFSRMKFPDHVRCRLCATCQSDTTHSPPVFRSCTFFPGQIPQKIQQRCCYSFHSALTPGTICPVVKALGPRPHRPIYNRPNYSNQGARPKFGQSQNRSGQRGPMVAKRPQYTTPKKVF